ncbi:two-component system response regulator DesR [Microbacterium natoriense]|uniref:Two-component system response regulator DesR n=1 Tax=Microbacterium natoriense TaxID=284570 RepID=A0AAW8ETF8_9MICO|nr:response regulator transcription factor [Microbacterium natoriense]MDQ0646204.1 two-component system response regulator DesR [Microbacterium natoriense]
MIRILVADDQSLIRHSIAAILSYEADFDVVGEASTGVEAVQLAHTLAPDLVLMDVHMPLQDGIAAAAEILSGENACRILMLTAFARPGYLSRAVKLGASGFLLKDTPPAELFDAIRTIHRGGLVLDPMLASESFALGDSPLTRREAQVLVSLLVDASTSAVAAAMHLSEGSVRNLISSAMTKLGAAQRLEAARIAYENGWL